jgi:hypothetical protein
MRYRLIETHKKVWPITLMCNVLNVSSSGFYEWVHRRPSRRAIANDRLDGHIRQVFDQHKQRYGAPRIVDEINGRGLSCSKNRVARRMRVGNPGDPVQEVQGHHRLEPCKPVAEDLINQDFTATRANEKWSATSPRVDRRGWLYLAVGDGSVFRAVVAGDEPADDPAADR